jgi:hypothetical protein
MRKIKTDRNETNRDEGSKKEVQEAKGKKLRNCEEGNGIKRRKQERKAGNKSERKEAKMKKDGKQKLIK